jgi:adenylate cyclase
MLLVDACLQLEQRPLGLQSVDEALEAVEQTGERLFEAELHRLRGELLAGANGSLPTEAVGCLQKAIATARAQEAASFELRAALSLAQLDRSDSHARQQLEAIVERIPAGFETPDLGAATRLLSGPPASH